MNNISPREFIKAAFNFEKDKCPFCGKNVDPEKEFSDQISRREYEISGLCQSCQDKTFGK